MKTDLSTDLLETPEGQTADKILRACVHCGFCLSTCPTYSILGDELDSPRGRIYLIKQALEDNEVSDNSLKHLDRCLTCRSCETTCPSGVEYGHLLDIGRKVMEQKSPRPWYQQLFRYTLRTLMTSPKLFSFLTTLAPWTRHHRRNTSLYHQVKSQAKTLPSDKTVLLISGCVQPSLAPNINLASKNVLQKLGYHILETPQSECCGAVNHHLSGENSALQQARHNIDAWSQHLDQGVEAIISNASGCGVMIKDYAHLLKDDPVYADKAKRLVKQTFDISEFLTGKDLSQFKKDSNRNIVFQSPCTLQHGQKLPGRVESLLTDLGFSLSAVKEPHLCCGSAGTYSIFQKTLSTQLRDNKLQSLQAESAEIIVTANIGCLLHLQKGTKTPVKHWIELL